MKSIIEEINTLNIIFTKIFFYLKHLFFVMFITSALNLFLMQLLRAREAAIWELEERQIHEKQQLAKRQLKDIFFLQRHQVKLQTA